MDLVLQNTLREIVDVDLGYNRMGNFRLRITAPSGLTAEPRTEREEGLARNSKVLLQPGASYLQQILLNQLYAFPETGDYRVAVTLVGSARTRSGAVVPLASPSEEFHLLVEPRNAEALDDVCRKLARSAVSRNAEQALESARALSYIPDLIAVPYLEKLTGEGPFGVVNQSIAVRGLARIAEAEGLDAVVSHLKRPNPELTASIAAALQVETMRRKPGAEP